MMPGRVWVIVHHALRSGIKGTLSQTAGPRASQAGTPKTWRGRVNPRCYSSRTPPAQRAVTVSTLVLARSGRMREARTLWTHAIAVAQQDSRRETAAIYEAAQAVCEAHCENTAAGRTSARSALDLARNRDVEYAAAFALPLPEIPPITTPGRRSDRSIPGRYARPV